jgi:small-conductance mechanosensitive channel
LKLNCRAFDSIYLMSSGIREKAPNAFPILPKSTWTVVLVLAVLLIMAITLTWSTRDAMASLPFLRSHAQTAEAPLVDLRPWQTAEDLAALAVTAEEQELAHEAEHLADHEVDQAFAAALRLAQASAQHRALSGESLALSQKAAQLQQLVNDDQAHVQALSAAAAKTPTLSTRTPADDSIPEANDLDIAKAQLGLDSDELNDAQHDLARALGDERGRIQQELNAHEAAMKKYDSEVASRNLGALATSRTYGSFARRLGAWFDQRNRYDLLLQAARQSDSDTHSLTSTHNQMEAQPASKPDSPTRQSHLNAMKSRAMHSQILSIFDDRIQTEQQLSAVYKRWSVQVQLQHRIVFHLLMRSLAWIILVVLAALLVDGLLRHLLRHPTLDRRFYTYRLLSRLTIQFVAAAIIALIVFGTPSEMPTIVGLTTAGLTVVLQDFIISFCGWFVLMGKNGIRVGDWVEINGVGGEVADIGVFRTSLLETGNWTDHGHPTGRRVAFSNSFAIKGQYFNFTTTGQWMWDEVTVTVPHSEDAYATVELIHKAVLEETLEESKKADEEWKRIGLSQSGTEAAVNMRPGAGGIDVVVRYVTRAYRRYEMRNRVYERLIELLHKPVNSNKDLVGTSPTSAV